MPSGNRLANETSPYLLQHASNPVHWHPWGEAAFEEARSRDVPIFLSVGYSTCYWCHVMERESFEHEGIASLMNERFVCIKVDREERPDIDDIYMTATQVMTGRGGWPMSAFLEAGSLRPFYCGTYFPPEPKSGMPSFPQVLEGMSEAWTTQRDAVLEQATKVGDAVREALGGARETVALGPGLLANAAQGMLQQFDRVNGGFGGAPKFPQPAFLSFLLSIRPMLDEATTTAIDEVVRVTLDRMMTGGIQDQVGGGFHRYAVDAHWIVPHFEKMLYDNAQLTEIYALASVAYGDAEYRRVAMRTIEYVLREMRDEAGGFHSAEDAEVDHREGLNYLWTPDEMHAVLGDDASFATSIHGLDDGPNFRDPHHPDESPRNVLRLGARLDRMAEQRGMDFDEFLERVESVNRRLLEARGKRPRPHRDDKVLASWNAMMIRSLAIAGRLLDHDEAIEAAKEAGRFLLDAMVVDDVVHRSWRRGTLGGPGFLEDASAVIRACVAMADVDEDPHWIERASAIASRARADFRDDSGIFFDTRDGQSDLFVRSCVTYDGASPCGASQVLHALIDLADGVGDASAKAALIRDASDLLRALSGPLSSSPLATITATEAMARLLRHPGTASDPSLFASDSESGTSRSTSFTPVEVFADRERVVVGDETPGLLQLAIRIAPGHHVMAATSNAEGMSPLRVGISGGSGVRVFADYPEGEATDDGPPVHHGEIRFQCVLEREGDWAGRPMLTVSFQACTEEMCLEPMTVELDVAIDQG